MWLSTAPEDPSRFIPLSIVLLLAFIVPILLSRFRRLPVVVGEIIAGVLVGPSLLGWVTDGPILTFMSNIGLAFLMFLAGLEIDLGAFHFSWRFPEKKGGVGDVQPPPLPFFRAVQLI
jgi:Kef-type K+ transport system membrane component KefB